MDPRLLMDSAFNYVPASPVSVKGVFVRNRQLLLIS